MTARGLRVVQDDADRMVAALGPLAPFADALAAALAPRVAAILAQDDSPGAPAPPEMLSMAEAAARLGVRRTTFHRLVASGALRTITVGRRRLVPAHELRRYIAERMT